MVFISAINLIRSRGPDEFWRKRKVFKLTAKFLGRRRNVYSNAIRALHKALIHATKGRAQKKKDRVELWNARIGGACLELDAVGESMVPNLSEVRVNETRVRNRVYNCFFTGKCDVAIDRKTLADLAIWEPRTFKCLTSVALMKQFQQKKRGLNDLEEPPEGVITRGML